MQPANPGARRRSPWLYVAFGCGGLVALGALVVGGFVAVVAWQGMKARRVMASPEARLEEVKRILGAKQLPEGYHAAAVLAVPLVADTVVLSREPPDATGLVRGGIQHGFSYHRMHSKPQGGQRMRQYLLGQDPAPGSQVEPTLQLWVDEVLARGTLSFPGYAVRYVSQRGRYKNGGYPVTEGLSAYVVFECPDRHQRTGIWHTPDPDPDAPAGSPALAGTPADEEAVRAFVSHFNPCQER